MKIKLVSDSHYMSIVGVGKSKNESGPALYSICHVLDFHILHASNLIAKEDACPTDVSICNMFSLVL